MSIGQRDYILRMIQQIAQAIAAIALRIREGKLDEARSALDETRRKIFGAMVDPLDRVDSPSVVTLLGAMEKARAYALLLAVEADLRAARGEGRGAARARRRALEVHLTAAARWPDDVRDEDRAAIVALGAEADVAALPAPLQAALAAARAAPRA